MRILIAGRGYDTPNRHEVGVFELDQARALLERGHDVRFAAVDTRSIRHRRPLGCRQFTLRGVPVIYSAIPAGARPAVLAEAAQRRCADMIWKQATAEGWQPQVVHAHFGAAMLSEARRHGVSTVYTEHFSLANQDSVSESELLREKKTYALADRVICVSHPLAERIRSRNAVEPVVVHNIVDAAFASARNSERQNRKSFCFVSAGSLTRRKGYDLVLTALSEVRLRTGADVRLTIIGEGEEHPALLSQARSLGLQDRVTFTGQLDRSAMVECYLQADAFVLASRRETFGVVYIEAMAMGLPVIATICGGPEDFVDSSNGYLVPAEDPGALSDAMERMVQERDGFDSRAIADNARTSFSARTIAAQLTAVYEEVIGC